MIVYILDRKNTFLCNKANTEYDNLSWYFNCFCSSITHWFSRVVHDIVSRSQKFSNIAVHTSPQRTHIITLSTIIQTAHVQLLDTNKTSKHNSNAELSLKCNHLPQNFTQLQNMGQLPIGSLQDNRWHIILTTTTTMKTELQNLPNTRRCAYWQLQRLSNNQDLKWKTKCQYWGTVGLSVADLIQCIKYFIS